METNEMIRYVFNNIAAAEFSFQFCALRAMFATFNSCQVREAMTNAQLLEWLKRNQKQIDVMSRAR